MTETGQETLDSKVRAAVRDILPGFVLAAIRRYRNNAGPPVGAIAFGDFRRTQPIGERFGCDRGTPVDRIYIERFLARHAPAIRGRTLEVVDDSYTRRFGLADTKREVVDFRADNARATIIGDLSNLDGAWDGQFDAIVVTQTLQLIFDVKAAIASMHRLLKPGGTVLTTVPGITSLDRSEADSWYWSFTQASMTRLFGEVFGPDNVAVEVFGNVGSAVCFLHGVAAEELSEAMLTPTDDRYPVIVGVRAVKGVTG
jgi:SAM-dependent methyltransferase